MDKTYRATKRVLKASPMILVALAESLCSDGISRDMSYYGAICFDDGGCTNGFTGPTAILGEAQFQRALTANTSGCRAKVADVQSLRDVENLGPFCLRKMRNDWLMSFASLLQKKSRCTCCLLGCIKMGTAGRIIWTTSLDESERMASPAVPWPRCSGQRWAARF